MAVKYLAGDRLQGTAAERAALVTVTNSSGDITWGTSSGRSGSGNDAYFSSGSWSGYAGSDETFVKGDGTATIEWSFKYIGNGNMLGFHKDPRDCGATYVYDCIEFYMYTWRDGSGSTNTNIACYQIDKSNGLPAVSIVNIGALAVATSDRMKLVMDSDGYVKFYLDQGSGYSELSGSASTRTATAGTYYAYCTGKNGGGCVDATYNFPNSYSYPNLPNGAIFEESDTGKHYMFDGTDTWNEVA